MVYATTLAVLSVVLLIGTASHADELHPARDPGVNARQHAQHQRIRAGVANGELTRPEAARLRHEQRDLRQLERAYKSDGELTRAERRDLHHEQNAASRHIYRQTHDSDTKRR